MTNHFYHAFYAMLEDEGGRVNHPSDAGGQTAFGVSRRFHPNARIWAILESLTGNELRNPLLSGEFTEALMDFYFDRFWERSAAGSCSKPMAVAVFSCAVWAGVPRSTLFLQRALNIVTDAGLVEDGKCGPKTRVAAEGAGSETLYRVYLQFLAGYAVERVQERPKNRAFLLGWLRRWQNKLVEADK